VPAGATRVGETRAWQWGTLTLSPNSLLVWTEKMLAALERGNDSRQWHTLIDKVWSPKNLSLALQTVVARQGAPGVDGQTTEAVATRAEEELAMIARLLQQDRYEPRPVRRVWIEKLGSREKRPLGIPTVRDRIVQTALLHLLEPIFERDFAEGSYGFRPGRSAQQAVARVEQYLAQGCAWVVDADLKGYFDSIPQAKLLALVREKIADRRILGLLEKFLRARRPGEREGMGTHSQWHTPRRGDQPALSEHLPRPARPHDGHARSADAALRGRLHCALPY